MDMPLTVRLVLGRCDMEIGSILNLGQGSVIQLDAPNQSQLELLVNERQIASAETVTKENGLLAARIVEVNSLEDRFMGLTQKD